MRKIAMRCTQEQFEDIKEYFKEYSLQEFDKDTYLTNYFRGRTNNIANITLIIWGEEVHEKWDKNIFLEACGIEPKYKITKETILKYKMKDEFPEMFETKETALINEAKKRGFKEGVMCNNSIVHNDSVKYNNYILKRGWFKYIDDRLIWEEFNEDIYPIFKDGIWAEIIQTITKEEAEKKLNCKII